MRFQKIWYVLPAKPQISLRIRAVWSEPLLVACIYYECWANDWTSFGVSKLERRLHRLVWVYTCQNTTLLEVTCHDWSIGTASANSAKFRGIRPRMYIADLRALITRVITWCWRYIMWRWRHRNHVNTIISVIAAKTNGLIKWSLCFFSIKYH